MMPEMSTAAKPACQVNPIGPQTMKEKKALMPRPGATATGKLAQRPMMSVAITVIHTVDTKASPNAMPVLDSRDNGEQITHRHESRDACENLPPDVRAGSLDFEIPV